MILQKLWDIDPGYFRLKHAAKTILAILVTLFLLQGKDPAFKLMAGIVSGFSMQGVVAKSFSARTKQIILLNVSYFLVFTLGLLVRDSDYGSTIVLTGAGFLANYVRRFGLQNSVAPMMGWTLCFFATTLPFSSTHEVWNHLYELVIALLVSGLVNSLIFYENYPRLFVANSNRLFKVLAQGMHEIRRYVLNRNSAPFDSVLFSGITDTLTRLLESNQAMDENVISSNLFSNQRENISTILLQQYALVHAYMMVIEACQALSWHQHPLPRRLRLDLGLIHKQFETLFASMTMQSDYSVETGARAVSLSTKLAYTRLVDPAMIILLLNLKLGFNLFNRHVLQLVRGSDDT